MKKYGIVLLICAAAVFAGCGNQKTTVNHQSGSVAVETSIMATTPVETTPEETTAKPSVEEMRASAEINKNQPFINLYRRDSGYTVFNKTTEYANQWVYYNDIGGFYSFATDESEFPYPGITDRFFSYWNSYGEAATTKIGYEVVITLKDGSVLVANVKNPADTAGIFDYVELYLYDDVHQAVGAWYSHLLPEQMTEETLMTSIKVTTGKNIEQVEKIVLTAYTYQSDEDFDAETGRYIGGNYTTLEIGRLE